MKKNPLRRCHFHLPLRRNRRSIAIGLNPIFSRSAVGGQAISVLITSSLCIWKDVSSISVLTCNGNSSYGTEERQWNGETVGNGMVETRHKSQVIQPYLVCVPNNPHFFVNLVEQAHSRHWRTLHRRFNTYMALAL